MLLQGVAHFWPQIVLLYWIRFKIKEGKSYSTYLNWSSADIFFVCHSICCLFHPLAFLQFNWNEAGIKYMS